MNGKNFSGKYQYLLDQNRDLYSMACQYFTGIARCNAMKNLVSSVKTERMGTKLYRTRANTKANLFIYIKYFYKSIHRHSSLVSSDPLPSNG